MSKFMPTSSTETWPRTRSRIVLSLVAIVLLIHVAPAVADDDGDGDVVITFTKWVTGTAVPLPNDQPAPTRFLMRGIVGGDLGKGAYVGEVLDHKLSTAGHTTIPINALEAIYEVQASETFEALIRGGQSNGRGLLEGTIMNGWRTGARVEVDFRVLPRCAGNPNPLGACFQGTIRVLADSDESEDDDD